MITDYYTLGFTVERLTSSGGSKKAYTNHLSGLVGSKQPLTAEYAQAGGFIYGKDWLLFTDNVDIQEGDRVTLDGVQFRVIAVEHFDMLRNQHMEIVIRKFDQ